MPENESALLVPLRSNASTLLAGAPIAAVRRRLKFASLFFDHIYLEDGTFRLHAGPDGAFGVVEPSSEQEPLRWQTAGQRHADQAASFTLAIGREPALGVPAQTMHTALSSQTSTSWAATLRPFTRELPVGTDWIDFVRTIDPTGEAARLIREWAREDEQNPALQRAIPERFVRNAIIRNANRDLGITAADRVAISIDPLHAQVAAQRFRDDDTWKLSGYAVPIIFPHVGDLPWEAIADLRRDNAMTRFRAVLRQVEEEAVAEAAGGDIEAAAQHAYRKHLAGYPDTLPSVGDIAHRTLTGFVIGGITGFTVSGIIGPLGTLAGAAFGTAATTVTDIRDVIRGRRARGWIALDHSIQALRKP